MFLKLFTFWSKISLKKRYFFYFYAHNPHFGGIIKPWKKGKVKKVMLYLISQKGSRTFKIGYTSNIRNRFRTYRTCMGSSFEVIATMEGTKTDEKDWHFFMEYLKFIKVEDAKEWYKIPKGITKDEIRKTGFHFFERH